jgi:hypothetical protein
MGSQWLPTLFAVYIRLREDDIPENPGLAR